MSASSASPLELTYPLRAAARLTGLSPEVLRAWERRHGVVEPVRTPGGTRRYSAEDLERLRLLKAAVDAGHRIGKIAQLGNAELEQCATEQAPEPATDGRDAILSALEALEALDAPEAQRLLSLQLSALGPIRFARHLALPLLQEIGERWATDRIGIAPEHLATNVLRSMLGSALMPTMSSQLGPKIVFGTPAGEPHELGLQTAALTALGAGANPIFLGADLPVADLVGAARSVGASALALGIVTVRAASAAELVSAARQMLPPDIALWIGGAGALEVALPPGVVRIAGLEELERRVALLCLTAGGS